MSKGISVGESVGENTGSSGNIYTNPGAPSAAITGGSIYPTLLESELILLPSASLIVELTNDTFIPDFEVPLEVRKTTTEDSSYAFLDIITTSQPSNIDNFKRGIVHETPKSAVTRTNSTTLTCNFDTDGTNYYEIFGENEVVGIYIPAEMLTTSAIDLYAGSFTVIASHLNALNATITIQPTGTISVV